MMREWVRPLVEYLKGQRIVSSPDVECIDAPGGLGKALITGTSVGRPQVFLCNVGGELKNVTFLITKIETPDPSP